MKNYSSKKIIVGSSLVALLGILSILWIFILEKIKYECPFRKLFHIWCPGCGGTRMVKSIMHFDFYQAFRYNPLVFIILLCTGIMVIIDVIRFLKNKPIIKPNIKFWIIFIIILIIYMILRNIPLFSFLIPTKV